MRLLREALRGDVSDLKKATWARQLREDEIFDLLMREVEKNALLMFEKGDPDARSVLEGIASVDRMLETWERRVDLEDL